MSEVNGAGWLMAIDAHPETLDTDLAVAAVMLSDGVIGLESIDGLSRESVDDAVNELIALGFLEDVFSMAGNGQEEYVLELRIP